MFKKILLAAALVAGGAILMPSQSEAGDPHCGPYGHHGYHGHYGHYGYRAARPVVVVPNYGYGTGVPYYGPSVRYGNYYGGYSAYRPGLNISIGAHRGAVTESEAHSAMDTAAGWACTWDANDRFRCALAILAAAAEDLSRFP